MESLCEILNEYFCSKFRCRMKLVNIFLYLNPLYFFMFWFFWKTPFSLFIWVSSFDCYDAWILNFNIYSWVLACNHLHLYFVSIKNRLHIYVLIKLKLKFEVLLSKILLLMYIFCNPEFSCISFLWACSLKKWPSRLKNIHC